MADDDVTPTVEDVIAEAVGRAMVLRTSPHEIAAAVVAAIRAATVEQQAELLDEGEVESSIAVRLRPDGEFHPTRVARAVGPWRAEP